VNKEKPTHKEGNMSMIEIKPQRIIKDLPHNLTRKQKRKSRSKDNKKNI
jgi:hypothetical protein